MPVILHTLGLTDAQKLERRKGIGASEANLIASGKWYDLWLEKIGEKQFKSPLSEWEAALRHCTEPLNLDWYEQTEQTELTMRGETVIGDLPYMRASLDAFDPHLPGPVDAKHISDWTPGDPIAWVHEKYFPQMQHQMMVTKTRKSALSVIIGSAAPVTVFIELDDFWCEAYQKMCDTFWACVRTRTPTPDMPITIKTPPYHEMRSVEMNTNSWASLAADWLADKDASKRFKVTEAALKELVDPDVREAKGSGIRITRSRGGALSIKGL